MKVVKQLLSLLSGHSLMPLSEYAFMEHERIKEENTTHHIMHIDIDQNLCLYKVGGI